jgi:ABC-2 type transport system permease protein
MTMPSDAAPAVAFEPRAATPRTPAATRPFYWSVRREIWENRSLYLAPLAVAALVLVGFLISAIGMPHRRLQTLTLPLDRQIAVISQPYDFAEMALIGAMVIVAVAYCVSALHTERRDRSILFWKSLPVSDLTTVLSKAAIPTVVLPAITAAVILLTHMAILLFSTVILLLGGVSPAVPLQMFTVPVSMIYGLVTMALWYAPIYAWLLLVSAWARRSPFLWAVLPPAALCLVEKLAFNTHHLASFLGHRLSGGGSEAFIGKGHGMNADITQLNPGGFLASPGVWLGLVFAAACLAGAVWLRRRREPI